MLTILDTGAGPNLIREDELDGDLTDLVKKKSTPELYDANKNPLEVTGTIDLTVQLGTRTLVASFLVVPKLAVPALLCADFCDEHVETIRPRRRIVELDDGTTIPIVRRRFNNSLRDESSTYAKLPEIRPNRRGNKQNVLRSTTNVWIPPNSQRGIEVKTTGHGLMTIESIQRQHSQHQLAVANGIIYVEPTRKTTILVSNFSDRPRRIKKGQGVANLERCPDYTVEVPICVAEVLDTAVFKDDKKSDSWGGEKIPSA